MEILTKIILFIVYPLVLFGRTLNLLLQRDPLRLSEPGDATFWIQRKPDQSWSSYFSEASESEGQSHSGFGRLAGSVLLLAARLSAQLPKRNGKHVRVASDPNDAVPDEVYTLW